MVHLALIAALLQFAIAEQFGSKPIDRSQFTESDTIRRDVAIIGGGSSGIHAAISLKDQGHSYIVVEKQPITGGHTRTYFAPITGTPINYGVQDFHNTSLVKSYFARLNVTVGSASFSDGPSENVDFRTGARVNVTAYSSEETSAAIKKYLQVISQWPDLEKGLFLPSPVPQDLLLPFGDFMKKYGIEAFLTIVNSFNQGIGDPTTMPTLEVIKANGQGLLNGLSQGYLVPANGANDAIYTSAQAELLADKSLLLNSEVIASNRRSTHGVELIVQTQAGRKLIIAKKLLIAIPPKLDLLGAFNPSRNETEVFRKFINGGLYTTILKNLGAPANITYTNTDPEKYPNNPAYPNVYEFSATSVSGLYWALYQTDRGNQSEPFQEGDVKSAIVADVKTLQKANPGWAKEPSPDFVAYSSHSPFYLQVSSEDIKNGFYADLYALQGQENTFWTGAAWRGEDSSSLWKFNQEVMLPKLVAAL